MGAALRKYGAILRITFKNQTAYIWDLVIRSLFLLIILYVFVQLWTVTYKGVGAKVIAGYRFDEIIWYLIFSESIVMALPRTNVTVEDEVKSGGVAYLLSKPMHYLMYHYAGYMGEFIVRFAVNLLMGGTLGMLLFGPPNFGLGWAGFVLATAGGVTVNFMLRMSLSLCAFWVEETQGLAFVYDKLVFTLGGMMLPLELFPDLLRKASQWLPFQTIVYFPVKTAIHFDAGRLAEMVGLQLAWTILLGAMLLGIYRRGVRKLNVNGG